MSEIKRYDARCEYAGEDEMVEHADGNYVSYAGYAALQQKLDAVVAENIALKGFFETGIGASFEGCDFFGDHMQSRALELGLVRQEVYRQDQHENMVVNACDFEDGDTVYFINETPATEAILNAVRAEAGAKALEDFAEFNLKSIDPDSDEYTEVLLETTRAARAFAAKLRAAILRNIEEADK